MTAIVTEGDSPPLTYTWGADADTDLAHSPTAPTATWEIPASGFEGATTYYAWVKITDTQGRESGCWGPDGPSAPEDCTNDGTACVVSVTQGENDLMCDDLTVSPAEPKVGDQVTFTCKGSTSFPYPLTPRIDFRIYYDSNEDGAFEVGDMDNCERECIASGSDSDPTPGDPSNPKDWTGTFSPDFYVQYGSYWAACRICIDGGEGFDFCTVWPLPPPPEPGD